MCRHPSRHKNSERSQCAGNHHVTKIAKGVVAADDKGWVNVVSVTALFTGRRNTDGHLVEDFTSDKNRDDSRLQLYGTECQCAKEPVPVHLYAEQATKNGVHCRSTIGSSNSVFCSDEVSIFTCVCRNYTAFTRDIE
ncbi:hypothetical protein FBUS_10650 [Fasciolopsis buskii]|uniref:Uncharacterized protein n=1 Tax=Fasciolopsis buskii TaxID=27845 RepID=A0A8E0VMB6_9TREM|nr:hypothetical protein FBUS_10650 [Fasciolopsis buski]